MIRNHRAFCAFSMLVLSLGVFAYGCGKDEDEGGSAASEEDIAKSVTAYGGLVNLLDFNSTLFVGSDASLRAAVAVAKAKIRHLQEEEEENLCDSFKENFCDATESSRAGLLSSCETACEDGATPTTICTMTENVAATCGNGENAQSITILEESTIEATTTCSEDEGAYSLTSAVTFEALLSSDSFEGTISLRCSFNQTNLIPSNTVESQGFSSCENFNCSVDGKGIPCEQFQTATEDSQCF